MKNLEIFTIIITFLSYFMILPQEQNWKEQIEQTMNANSFNGLVVITQNNEIIFEKICDSTGLVQKNSEFLIGSISKQITAVVILQLVDQNLVNIHTPIYQYLPELHQDWAKKVTLQHLLSHTSGIQGLDQDLAFEPGSQFKYSAIIPFYLASQIAEKVSGKKFTTLVQELFTQASMPNSHVVISEKFIENQTQYPNIVTGFDALHTPLEPVTIVGENGNVYNESWAPGTGVISCVSDLLQWNVFIHTQQLLSSQSYDALTTSYIGREHPRYGYVGYGLGLQIYQRDGLLEFSHRGYLSGYTSTLLYLPVQKISLIILENFSRDPLNLKQALYTHDQIRILVQKALLENKI